CAEKSVTFRVTSRDTEFPLCVAVQRLKLVEVERPVPDHSVETLQFEITDEIPWAVATPRPCATANHSVITGFECVLSSIGVVVIFFFSCSRLIRLISLILEFQLRVFRRGGEDSALEIVIGREHVATIALSIHI